MRQLFVINHAIVDNQLPDMRSLIKFLNLEIVLQSYCLLQVDLLLDQQEHILVHIDETRIDCEIGLVLVRLIVVEVEQCLISGDSAVLAR